MTLELLKKESLSVGKTNLLVKFLALGHHSYFKKPDMQIFLNEVCAP